ncbi:MAG: hypothetical protein KAY24_07005 [Candidatus Eisenbacteria sp.]|nr:hypothetical protein [Candidatus Eisenbacteria bacterium]
MNSASVVSRVVLLVLGCFLLHASVGATPNAQEWLDTEPYFNDLNGLHGRVECLALYEGSLVVGGRFLTAGSASKEVTLNGIARWDDGAQEWKPFDGGMTDDHYTEVLSLVVYKGDLIAGGRFDTASNNTCSSIALWDGVTWQPLTDEETTTQGVSGASPATDNRIFDMLVQGDTLIVAGDFESAGGRSAKRVAKWDGALWHTMNSEFDDHAQDLVIHDERLIAVGNFTGKVAELDPVSQSWSLVGGGLEGVAVYGAYSDDTALYVTGYFYTAGGDIRNIAMWTEDEPGPVGSWHELGSGLAGGQAGGAIRSIGRYAGDLIVTGDFRTADGEPANSIASWDSVSWSPLGNGLTEAVPANEVYGSDQLIVNDILYVSGTFTRADNIPSYYIAKYVSPCPQPLCTILGTVTAGAIPIIGGTIDLYDRADPAHLLLAERLTAGDGTYGFADLEAGDYCVELVLPLGYEMVAGEDEVVDVTVAPGESVIVDFSLNEIITVVDARSAGYWKHQYKAHESQRGNAQESLTDLAEYHSTIYDRFYGRTDEYAIRIAGVTFSDGSVALSNADALETLSARRQASMLDRARREYLGLLLNVVSGKVGLPQEATFGGSTVSQVVTYVADLLEDGDVSNDELAKDLAEMVNHNEQIPGDPVPAGTPNLAYCRPLASVGSQLSFVRPNPAQRFAGISFTVPSAGGRVDLKIYDQEGRLVRTLFEGSTDGGAHRAVWLGDDNRGRSVATGVYYYRIQVEDRAESRTILLQR